MQLLTSAFLKTPEIDNLCHKMASGRNVAAISGLSHIHKALLSAAIAKRAGKTVVYLAADDSEAVRMTEDLCALGQDAQFFPARDYVLRPVSGVSREFEHKRLGVLSSLCEGGEAVVVTTTDAMRGYILPPEVFRRHILRLELGQTITPAEVVARLVGAGYARADIPEGAGQFALRGGILDIHPVSAAAPVRLEFWGDQIDSVALFDPLTGRRFEQIKNIEIPPAQELLGCGEAAVVARLRALADGAKTEAARQNLAEAAEAAEQGLALPGADRFITQIYESPCTLLDYIERPVMIVSEWPAVKERIRTTDWQYGEDITQLLEEGLLTEGCGEIYMPLPALVSRFEETGCVFADSFSRGRSEFKLDDIISLSMRQMPLWGGGMEQLMEDIGPALREGYAVCVLAGSSKGAAALLRDLQAEGINASYSPKGNDNETASGMAPGITPGAVTVLSGALSGGFALPDVKFMCISHGRLNVVSKRRMTAARQKNKNARALSSIEELSAGDYVVHVTHGIGLFDGVHSMTVGGVCKDYIKIRYLGADVLYVPVTQLDMVSKYIGNTEGGLKLNKMGGSGWQKTKSRVRAAIKEMASELIALYSQRLALKGHAFAADTELQHDFESRFEYDETDDQLECIDDIKRDMERTIPMERLLCGDVGFGKTEVALRGAFKCIAEGKQCAILVPTTILASQHYNTICARMQGQAVNIEMLSRFRTARQQADIKKRLKSGDIDMIVGTHRLISNDVEFNDLGLLIVDEEQRFGVQQKERLKEKFPLVDALTLSATPIPRTLNMAMSGVRDMSSIEQAPHDRQPVQTYVLEYDKGVLYDAIRKEMRRGGQAFYMHNRVESIAGTAANIAASIEGCRVGVAHGQMDEYELSVVWKQLVDSELDVLVCTTIIETGVDVPNANTLIIEDADKLGLAQLHQIRGRVGRSPRRAYAYLTFRRGKALSDIATKRLEAVREFTEFGAGFKIAMRDLEIRGAGNILGGQQSGHMESVGYDMYLKLLSDAMAEQKGEPIKPEADCLIDLRIDAHIPENYISVLPHRLSVYRRIAAIRTREDAEDVIDELCDRFGEPPRAVMGLIDIALVRGAAAENGIVEIAQNEHSVLLYPDKLDMDMVSVMVGRLKGRVLLSAGARPYISLRLKRGENLLENLKVLLNVG